MTSTRDRILDAAEAQFAEKGFHGASLRAVTEAAGVNLASVNYHFGSKAALFVAVIERRVGPINRERIRRLDELEAGSDGGPLEVGDVLRCLLAPALALCGQPDHAHFLQLVGRMQSLPSDQLALLRDLFAEIEARFLPVLRRALPEVRDDVFLWRFTFVHGVMCSAMADPERIRCVSHGRCDPANGPEVEDQIVAFCSAGLRAPAPTSPPTSASTERKETR